ncbi:MAG: sulfatase/phosphatase domain-containing protein, partial [Planctomycetota bacterium]
LAGEEPTDDFLNRNLYFHYPHNRTTMPHSAIVSGDWKVMHFYERPDLPMLFNLSTDAGEVRNIAGKKPGVHERLHNAMFEYFGEVGARIPKLNPNYDPATYKATKKYQEKVKLGPFEGSRPLEADEQPQPGPPTPVPSTPVAASL